MEQLLQEPLPKNQRLQRQVILQMYLDCWDLHSPHSELVSVDSYGRGKENKTRKLRKIFKKSSKKIKIAHWHHYGEVINFQTNRITLKTDEAEIKVIMRAQRVREGESRVEMQVAKWTAEGAVKGFDCMDIILRRNTVIRVFCDVWAYVSCRRYVSIS